MTRTRLYIFLLCALLCTALAPSQELAITITVSPRPDPALSTWKTRQETVIMTVTNKGRSSVTARIRCIVRKGGDRVAQTNDARMPEMSFPVGVSMYHADRVIPFDAVDFYGSAKNTAARTGMLPEGAYELCVVLIDAKANWIGTEVCTGFMLTDYQPPVLLTPPDASVLRPDERPVFRWTPVTPQPAYIVRYQVLVFEVLQGQRPTQALRVNRPILDKTLQGATELVWPPEYQLPGRVEKYVWTVRALDDRNQPVGMDRGYTAGYAEPFGFSTVKSTTMSNEGMSMVKQSEFQAQADLDASANAVLLRSIERENKAWERDDQNDTMIDEEGRAWARYKESAVGDQASIPRRVPMEIQIVPSSDPTTSPSESGDPKMPEMLTVIGNATRCIGGAPITLMATPTQYHVSCNAPLVWYNGATNQSLGPQPWNTLVYSPTAPGWYSFYAMCPQHPNPSNIMNVQVIEAAVSPTFSWWQPLNPQPVGEGYRFTCGQQMKVAASYPGVTTSSGSLTHTWTILEGASCLTNVWTHQNWFRARCGTGTGCDCSVLIEYTVTDGNGCTGSKKLFITCKAQ